MHGRPGAAASGTAAPTRLLPLLREVGDLKRVTSAGRPGSIATRAFRAAWAALVSGADARQVAFAVTARTLAATRLGDLDAAALSALGLSEGETLEVLRAGLADIGGGADGDLRGHLRDALATPSARTDARLPDFVAALEGQPRAGVTCPGRGRIVLQPAENHAEHCLAVAVYGVLLAQVYGADPATVFLAGLSHHFHNAAMPDSGFTGEMLLGRHLQPVMDRANARALAELPQRLRGLVEEARAILPDDATPEGRAFHAADVLDRVLEIEQHLAASGLTMATVLGEMELVHAGPVKPFHDGVLRAFGLMP